MSTGPKWRRYLRFWGPDVDADVEDELRFHLEMRAAHLEARGHPPDEARRLARARFGDIDRVRGWLRAHDRNRQRREERIEAMDAILFDLRYALRKLRLAPGFTIAVILVLGLGIGAATAMFSAVDAALLRPLPFQHDERLVLVDGVNIPIVGWTHSGEMPTLADAQAMHDVFSDVAAYAPGGLNLAGAGSPARVRVGLVTSNLFATLGVRPALGRGFTPGEGMPDGARVAVLSDGVWRRDFGGDTAVIGRDIRLNEVPYRIVGVMPPGFGFPEETEVWTPLPVPFDPDRWEAFRQYMPSAMIARLAPGATRAAAEAHVRDLVRRFMSPDRRDRMSPEPLVQPLREMLVGSRRTALLVLMGATALVLLVACANVANLLLARAATRRGELTLRAALGAGRGRLARQLLVESVLLALAGGALGVALAYASLDALAGLMPARLAGTAPLQVDLRVLGFSTALALLTGLAFGAWPAFGASRADPNEAIKAVTGGAVARAGSRARRALVVVELAVALMLAVGAGLLLRSLQSLLATELGFRTEHVATLELSLAAATYDTPARQRRFFHDVLARLEASGGIQAAGFVNDLPLRGGGGVGFSVKPEGGELPEDMELRFAIDLAVTPGYFAAMGIPLVQGRTLSAVYDSTRPAEVVLNQRGARAYWGDANPVGRRVVVAGRDTAVVVGVVGDVRGSQIDEAPGAQLYRALDRLPLPNVALVARGPLEPRTLARRMVDAVRAVDPGQAVYRVRPLEDVVGAAVAPRRTNTALITIFGIVAVVLAAIGVYGVIAYGITQRTREIGIRMALGAQRGDVLRLVVREGLVLAALGLVLGLAGAWALRRVLASLLYGVTPADPVAFTAAALVLLAVALAATLLPARRALRVDPARTMRTE
ncbi:MAG TPA: ABC transporter permease [Gemmatimonadaceae bacterium]|nr:ABC transporter permease [Gemmatimonadaceae bacterium]